jgi:deoxyribonuclease-4
MAKIGFHIPLMKSAYESVRYHFERGNGIREFQIFIKNPRQFKITQIKDDDARLCRDYIRERGIFLITHASYLLNTANPEKWEMKIANGINEIDLAEKIGAYGVVFHVGKHLKLPVSEGEDLMFQYIQHMIRHIQEKGYETKFILETSAHCGTELCWRIEDLGRMFHRFDEMEKKHLKICIDTCHVFSAGYRIHNEEGCHTFIDLVEREIKWSNVGVIHLNDSLSIGGCGCKADRHANIMKGFIMDGMKTLLEHTINHEIPHILETPIPSEEKIFDTHFEEIEQIHGWFS